MHIAVRPKALAPMLPTTRGSSAPEAKQRSRTIPVCGSICSQKKTKLARSISSSRRMSSRESTRRPMSLGDGGGWIGGRALARCAKGPSDAAQTAPKAPMPNNASRRVRSREVIADKFGSSLIRRRRARRVIAPRRPNRLSKEYPKVPRFFNGLVVQVLRQVDRGRGCLLLRRGGACRCRRMRVVGFEADLGEHRLNFGVGHEELPNQAGAVVFGHNYDGRLVEAHENRGEPVLVEIESVTRTVGTPEAVAEIAIEMLEGEHRSFGRIRERRERAGGRHGADVVVFIRRVGDVAVRAVARGETPGIGTVAFVLFGILD